MMQFQGIKRIGRRRVAQILVVIGIVIFCLRESRILWGIEGLEYFDLAYWGIHISDEIYTLQNMIGIVGGIIALLWVSQDRSPEIVLNYTIHAPETFSGDNPKRRKKGRRDEKTESPKKPSSPLELIFKKDEEEK